MLSSCPVLYDPSLNMNRDVMKKQIMEVTAGVSGEYLQLEQLANLLKANTEAGTYHVNQTTSDFCGI